MSQNNRRYFLTVFLLIVSLFNNASANKVDTINRGYIFTAPKKILAGETESGCLSFHNFEPPAHVLLELLSPISSNRDEEILASTSTFLESGVETCLELSIPDRAQMTYTMGRLRLKIRFDKHPEYHVNTEKDVYIEYDSSIIFVETDKPIYKPGQEVNIRLLALTHDLKPWKRTIPKVWIETPAEIRVAQWTNLSVDRGIVQLVFPLSSEPSFGTWRIKVEKKKSHSHLVHTSTFEVKKYVLPKFQVTIRGPSYILADADNATWVVCAKYSYGEPVRGTLKIKSTSQTPSWRRRHNFPEINYETRIESPDGCIEPFTISSLAMGLPNWEVAPNSILISANLTEDGTGTTETATFRAVVVHQALKLEFLPYTPKYFKVGLIYHGKLRVLRHDDTPAANEKIQLCLRVRGKDEWAEIVVECKNFTSSPMGFVNFIVPPQHKNIILLSFIATGIEYPTKYYSLDKRWRVFMNQPSANIRIYAWYSPSDSYLAVARGDQPIVCGEKYPFNVMYTVPSEEISNKSIAFHYSINSKGDLLIFGHVKHKPHPDSILNYSEFKNVLGGSIDHQHHHHLHHHHHHLYNSTNRSENTHNIVYRFPLSVKVTPSMAPISELLLYYVRHDGETVATTYTIEVSGSCFENRVKTSWTDEVKKPGEVSRYNIDAAPWSLCGVSVIDQATTFLSDSKRSLLDPETVFDQTKRFHLNGDSSTLNQRTWSHCKKTTQPETSIEEIDRLPSPAVEAPPVWDLRAAVAWRKRSLAEQAHRRKRSFFISGGNNYVDAMQAFDDFGVIVMTNLVIETRPCPQFHWSMGSFEGINFDLGLRGVDEPDRMWGKMPLAVPLLNIGAIESSVIADVSYVDQLNVGGSPRSFFPETWLWQLVSTGKDGKAMIKQTLPDSITNWVSHTVCISSNYGLGISPPIELTAFQPFFLDYSLPYSVKRGELLRMKVSLFNYMQYNLPVNIHLLSAPGFDLHLSNSLVKYCLHPRKSIVHEYLLRPRVIGEINITVSAIVVPENREACQYPEDIDVTQDTIIKPILVQPEGFLVESIKSSFMCPKDFNDDSSISWNLTLPEDVVADSARAFVSLAGDLLGSALENLDNLVRLPFGCGEQNLILFVPNIHVLNYLDATRSQFNPEIRKKAIKNMEKGYQRELNYRHPDGSYSAFGPESSQTSGSMWLTAFVVKSFAHSKKYIHIDDRDLKLSVKWILKKQLDNGCFPVIGTVFHKDMKGGLEIDKSQNHSIALTAYVLISLIESGKSLPPSIISNALDCLLNETSYRNQSNPYTLTLITYALSLLEHPSANASMNLLVSKATRLHDLLWWENKNRPSASLNIEMTAYCILSLVKLGGNDNMALALKAIRWLSKQRNIEGGFISTQDTVIGLEALAKYATVMTTNSTDLSILLTAGEMDKVIRMNDDNRMIFVQTRLPVLPTFLEIFVEGEGCVLVQIHLKYNVKNFSGSEAFDLSVRTEPVASGDECSMQKINICTRYNMADGESNMALLQVGMISGFEPDKGSLLALVEQTDITRVKRFEDDHNSVTIYFDKLTADINCISFLVSRENIVENPEPANVKVFDYYQQELFEATNYTFFQNCTRNIENTLDEKLNDLPEVSTVKPVTTSRIKENIEEKSSKIMTEGLVENKNRDNMLFVEDLEETVIPLTVKPTVKTTSESSDFDKSNDGSGHDILEETDLNPSFVIINHELDTPDGVEGPPPVYVKPSFDISKMDDELEMQNKSNEMKLTGSFNDSLKNQSIDLTRNTSEICPLCGEKAPPNFEQIYCSASNVVKVAVRRSRKIRLLLDVRTDYKSTRLHSTTVLSLDNQCTCPVIDKPGSLAMIVTSKSNDSILNADPSQPYQLDGSVIVYSIPNIARTPAEIIQARISCSEII